MSEENIKSDNQNVEQNAESCKDTVNKSKNDKQITISENEYKKCLEQESDSKNLALRMKADYENYKRTVDRQKAEYQIISHMTYIKKLLPVLDTFDQALNSAKSEDEKKGIGLIYSQMMDILSKDGLKAIDTVGKTFDPNFHEIMMKEKSDENDDIILEEFQKGYMLKDKVLRHSKVKVSELK